MRRFTVSKRHFSRRFQLNFEDAELLKWLEQATATELDALNFGVIRMSFDTRVTHYSATEARGAGLRPETVLAKRFFIEVGVCMNNYLVAQRYLDEAELDALVPYIFTFIMKPTKVRLRLLRSATAQSMYLLVER
jgi:photoactive yellow protein